MLGLFAIVLSLALLMTLAYRGYSVLLLAPACALLAVLLSGGGNVLLGTYTQVFMTGLGGFVVNYFPLFLMGALFGKLMEDSGSAAVIARGLAGKLGAHRAVLSIVLASAILTYGGVSVFVIGFAVFPIAAALFREADVPKRLIPGAIGLGSLTFTMTALPGTPSIQNAIPMPFFGTDAFAAPGLGLIAGVIMLVGGQMWLEYRTRTLKARGEGYGGDMVVAGIAVPETPPLDRHRGGPGLKVALAPVFTVIAMNFLFSRVLLPMLDTSYLAEPEYGETTLSSVLGIWSIFVSLVAACLVIVVANRRRWTHLKDSLNKGALGSLLPIFNTASEVGYGSVIASLAAFVLVRDFLAGIAPGNPLISEAILVTTLAGITGSASGGLAIALETMGDTYVAMAQAAGIAPELMHRVASIASGGLDSLPHNGAVITLLTICGLSHRQSYPDLFMAALVVPVSALVVVIALGTAFGSF